MSETASNEAVSAESEKPAQDTVKFPPLPDPSDDDFDEDICSDEKKYYVTIFSDLNKVTTYRLHCSACDKHLGTSSRNETKFRKHPLLRTLVCSTCYAFYNSGEFDKGEDGSELYCRWCGEGGQVYCCSNCPHVFCAKCIKRNLGMPKIKEIENTDDWKCFKCNSECIWELRATCWALLRYCELKNKIARSTENAILKEAYFKDCALDHSVCCKHKNRRRERLETNRKKEPEVTAKKVSTVIPKMPPTIQVKKFASVNINDLPVPERIAVKRPISPKPKQYIIRNPIPILTSKVISTPSTPPSKKMRMCSPIQNTSNIVRFPNSIENKVLTYARIRPKQMSAISNQFNGFNNTTVFNPFTPSDNINLSLDSLTQGLDMSAVASMSNSNMLDNDVVCTPDLPMESICDDNEENDDDVQCITPGPMQLSPRVLNPLPQPSLMNNPPPLITRGTNVLPDMTNDNIIQMTDNDVTVNTLTGGLKFRVDPQTLSSNKMYRLPDGRVFAINANPNMPGGYSATIVAITDTPGKPAAKPVTYAAKLNAIRSPQTSTPGSTKANRKTAKSKRSRAKRHMVKVKPAQLLDEVTSSRECDLNVPVEWYRYNLIDAVDALDYSLTRLHKLKKEATTLHLRTRTIDEMRGLHKNLERLLNTSAIRFKEIRENLNKGFSNYLLKKAEKGISEDDDDDVEILSNVGNDDPIFIDENSMDSNENGAANQEVDLTGAGSSDHNDSGEKRDSNLSKGDIDPLSTTEQESANLSDNAEQNHLTNAISNSGIKENKDDKPLDNSLIINNGVIEAEQCEVKDKFSIFLKCTESIQKDDTFANNENTLQCDQVREAIDAIKDVSSHSLHHDPHKKSESNDSLNRESQIEKDTVDRKEINEQINNCENARFEKVTTPSGVSEEIKKVSDDIKLESEMSEEMIQDLLKDDIVADDLNNTTKSIDVLEKLQTS